MKITKRQLRGVIREALARVNEAPDEKTFSAKSGKWEYIFSPFKQKWAVLVGDKKVAEGPTNKSSSPVPLTKDDGEDLREVIGAWQEANEEDIKYGFSPEYTTLTKGGELFSDLHLEDKDAYDDDSDSNALLAAIAAARDEMAEQWR
jgi:hypothetical protein